MGQIKYDKSHRILLVGEGDFSFSLCLAKAFGTAQNMVSTSLDSIPVLEMDYENAVSNLEELKALGCTTLQDVNAKSMSYHPYLGQEKFDRIIYNFPHAGFIGSEKDPHQIELHRTLVSAFLRNAKEMLNPGGEIHITHKTTHPFTLWNIPELATSEGLSLVKEEKFKPSLYKGYNIKRGAGSRCDQPFKVGKSNTFVFANLYKDDIQKYKKKTFKDALLKNTRLCF